MLSKRFRISLTRLVIILIFFLNSGSSSTSNQANYLDGLEWEPEYFLKNFIPVSYQQSKNLENHFHNTIVAKSFSSLCLSLQRLGKSLISFEHQIKKDDTRPLASVSKTFTAVMLLMLLEEQTKVSIDTPIRIILGNKVNFLRDKLTIRHLLTHTSGLPYLKSGVHYKKGGRVGSYFIPQQYIKEGVQFNYSNANYHLLAVIIEKYCGISYQQCIKEKIIQPLGLQNTRVSFNASGAAGIYSSTENLHTFIQAVFSQSEPSLLTTDSIKQIVARPPIDKNISKDYYGLGVRVRIGEKGKIESIYHVGIWNKTYSEYRYFPKFQASMISLGSPNNFRSPKVNNFRYQTPRLILQFLVDKAVLKRVSRKFNI